MGFQSRFLVWFQDQEVGQVAVKGLADQIEVVKADFAREFIVVFVDRCRPNTSHTGKVGLRQPPFAEAG